MNTNTEKTAWSGWNTQQTIVPNLLEDVMSQELAEKLQKEEEELAYGVKLKDLHIQPQNSDAVGGCDETDNDLLMAQMLQLEYDKEADQLLKREQDHYNQNSKISLSFEKYRNVHPSQQEEVYSEEEEVASEHKPYTPDNQFGRRGIRGTGKGIVTKHDLQMNYKKNAANVLDKFSLDMDTGDTERHNTMLPNKVYNKLRSHCKAESKRSARLHEKKDQSTATQAVDQKTRLQLFKMMNSGLLEEVNGVISVGKESAVLHAVGGEIEDPRTHTTVRIPDEVALKVYKTTLSEFKNREKYVRGDFRLANEFSKQNPRKVMRMWAEKEMLNLKRMRKFGIACPEVVKLKKHILVMQFIGRDQVAAPKLKDAELSPEEATSAYHQVLTGMKSMYKDCVLVHADLSEYNLLWYEGRVYFIDVSQAVDLSHPLALEFLLRDCRNVKHFFTKVGVSDVPTEYEMFNDITGMDLPLQTTESEFLQQIQEYEKEAACYDLDSQRKEFAFDYMFEKHKKHSDSSSDSDVDLDTV